MEADGRTGDVRPDREPGASTAPQRRTPVGPVQWSIIGRIVHDELAGDAISRRAVPDPSTTTKAADVDLSSMTAAVDKQILLGFVELERFGGIPVSVGGR